LSVFLLRQGLAFFILGVVSLFFYPSYELIIMIKHFFIPLLLGLLTLNSTTSLACKDGHVDYDFAYWLKLNDAELQRTGCVREQIKFRMFSHNNDTKNVIKSGKKLRKKHILDNLDLQIEADALYTAKRYDEALGLFLLSQDQDRWGKCNLFRRSSCGIDWKLQSMVDRYLLYKYYRATNRNLAADKVLNETNVEYEKTYRDNTRRTIIFQQLGIEPTQ
jgi:hypothetical protein